MREIPIVFSSAELLSMRLKNGVFSLTRFKRIFKKKVCELLLLRIRESGEVAPEIAFTFGRVAVRNIDEKAPKDFFLDVSCVSKSGDVRWRQTFRYIFNNPNQGLRGTLVPGRRRYAK